MKILKMRSSWLLLFLVGSVQLSIAQNKDFKKYKEFLYNQQITIDNRDSVMKFHIDVTNLNVHTKKTRDYYWYEYGQLQVTQGGYSGKLLDGEYRLLSSTKTMIEKGLFVAGLKEGEWFRWRKSGKLFSTEKWHHGLKEGISNYYDENGQLKQVKHYHHNQLHGKVIQIEKDTVLVSHYKHGELIEKEIDEEEGDEKTCFFKKIFKKKEGKESVNTEQKPEEKEGFFKRLFKSKDDKEPKEDKKEKVKKPASAKTKKGKIKK